MKTIQQLGKKYIGSLLLLILLITGTYYFILRDCNLMLLLDSIRTADDRFLVAGIVAVIIYIGCEGICIKSIAKSLQVRIGYVRSFCYACIDIYYCGITPSATGGQPVLAYYMSKDQIPISKTTLILLLYTIQYKLVLVLFGVGILFLQTGIYIPNQWSVWVLFFIGLVVNVAFIVLGILCMYSVNSLTKIVKKLVIFLSRLHIVKNTEKKLVKVEELIKEYHRKAVYIRNNVKVLFKVFFITLIQRFSLFSVGYFVYRSFGLNKVGYIEIIALQVLLALAVDSLPLPGGVGISEGMFLMVYQMVYEMQYITPAMLLTRGINFYFCLLLCGIVTIVYHIIGRKSEANRKGE